MKNSHFRLLNAIIKIFVLLAFCNLMAQGVPQLPDMPNGLPKVLPPSPTVSGLMKFEEVPVDNYVGIPDITIPIYNIGTHSKDVSVNLSLKYHPSSIAIDEDASFTGLGWSLFAGGTISRTVRGLPDDWNVNAGSGMMGIYNSNNPYYESRDIFNLPAGTWTEGQTETFNKLIWEAAERGTYDTEHDLYQYNFMGHSGRFYIKKNGNSYEVIKLDNDNVLLISYDHSTKRFLITDDKNITFTFDILEETSQNNGDTTFQYFGPSFIHGSSFQSGVNYISAFHLSRITDANNKCIVTFDFNDPETEPMSEISRDASSSYTYLRNYTVVNEILDYCDDETELQKIGPKLATSVSFRNTSTRKIKQINVEGKVKIQFIHTNDRTDTDNEGTYRLSEVLIKNWAYPNTVVKNFTLEYFNSMIHMTGYPDKSRMKLRKVIESDGSGTLPQSYELEYVEADHTISYTKDYWGYLNHVLPYMPPFLHRSTNPTDCKIDVLQKMRLPSGGAIVFNFETNTYSYSGALALDNFDENIFNWDYYEDNFSFESNGGSSAPQTLPLIGMGTCYVSFQPISNSVDGNYGSFWLEEKLPNGQWGNQRGINCMDNTGCYTPELELPPGEYRITFHWLNSEVAGSGSIKAYIRYRNTNNFQYLHGGGVRIKNIGYFTDGNVSRQYYDGLMFQGDLNPAKQKDYDYRFFGNALKSSGSLVFPRPYFVESVAKEIEIKRVMSGMISYRIFEISAVKYSSMNRLNPLKTKGSDVGYKNVKVSETGNGRSQFTYTSAIDHPEYYNDSASPYTVSQNWDYKRGLLEMEDHYGENNNRLSLTTYGYSKEEGSYVSGFKVNTIIPCKFMYFYSNFNSYYSTASGCLQTADPTGLLCPRQCGLPADFIGYPEVKENFGWVKLTSKETNEYFYTSANALQGNIVTKETFDYNPTNKRIAWHETETYNSNGNIEKIRNDYSYYDWPNNNNLSSINTIETRKNGVLISSQKMLYSNTNPGNVSYLPVTVQAAKGDWPLENKVHFEKYDAWSNPLQVRQENGIPISYIWGYNKTQPIAMIENATYEQLATVLGTSVDNIRDNYSEADLEAINALRTSMPNIMVTTYTYDPLIGVKSITDPKGYITKYEYDEMLRLKEVRDQGNKLLSENKYHYRTP
ncbi:hypothetical protein [Flavobacterium sp.]|uniref:hypothetical protein n=1 Tax=Flavobacterium sp. TaxID=239 RepID=UPI004034AA80